MTDCRGGVDDSTGCRGGDGVATRRPARAEEATRLASGRHGKPSRPHESWIPSAWKKKGSGLRPSDGWAAKVRKNLARWRLARGRQPRENAGIPPGKRAAKVALKVCRNSSEDAMSIEATSCSSTSFLSSTILACM